MWSLRELSGHDHWNCRWAPETTAADTQRAARMMADAGAALVLFAGGDGTAADIVRAIGQRVPILGIPSGVKMRSGVFAASPEAAGELAAEFLARADRPVTAADVVDVVEGGGQEGDRRVTSRRAPGPGQRAERGAGPASRAEKLVGYGLGGDARRLVPRGGQRTRPRHALHLRARARQREGSWGSWAYPARRSASTR